MPHAGMLISGMSMSINDYAQRVLLFSKKATFKTRGAVLVSPELGALRS